MPDRRKLVLTAAVALVLVLAGAAAQPSGGGRRWAKYEAEMQDPWPDPPGAWDNTEFAGAAFASAPTATVDEAAVTGAGAAHAGAPTRISRTGSSSSHCAA